MGRQTGASVSRAQGECESAMEKLFDYLDGELTAERMRVVREHIRSCSSCYPHYDFEKLVLDSLNTLREEKGAPEELRKKVLEALKAEGFSA